MGWRGNKNSKPVRKEKVYWKRCIHCHGSAIFDKRYGYSTNAFRFFKPWQSKLYANPWLKDIDKVSISIFPCICINCGEVEWIVHDLKGFLKEYEEANQEGILEFMEVRVENKRSHH